MLTLPFSKALSSISEAIIAGGWIGLFLTNREELKLSGFKIKDFILPFVFLLYILGVFWSTNKLIALSELNIKHGLLVFPILLLTVRQDWEEKRQLLRAFAFSNMLAALCMLLASGFDIRFGFMKDESGYQGEGYYKICPDAPFGFGETIILKKGDLLEAGFSTLDSSKASLCVQNEKSFFSHSGSGRVSYSFIAQDSIQKFSVFSSSDSGLSVIICEPFIKINGKSLQLHHEYHNASVPSPFNQRPRTGLLLVFALMIGVYEVLNASDKTGRIAWFIVSCVLLIALVSLQVRIAYVGLVVAGIVLAIIELKKRFGVLVYGVVLVGVVALALIPPVQQSFIRGANELKEMKNKSVRSYGSFNKRWILWKLYADVSLDAGIRGTGTGDVEAAARKMALKNGIDLSLVHRPHNQFLSAFVQFGWVLGAIWSALMLWFVWVIIRTKNNSLATAFGILFLLSMLTDNTLDTQTGATWALFIGVLFSYSDEDQNASSL